MKALIIALSIVPLALAAAPASASPNVVQRKAGDLSKGCVTLGVVRLCAEVDQPLQIAGKSTDLLIGPWGEVRPYELERRGNAYRVKVGNPSIADTDFFYFDELSFAKVGSHYFLSKATVGSSHECDDRPDAKRVDVLDFQRGTLTTILEPAWTASGKGWQFVQKVRTPKADVREMTFVRLTELMAETPANKQICEIYG